MALSLYQYLVIGFVTAAILIPIVRWFWKRFDLPSKRALKILQRQEEDEKEREMWAMIEAKVEAEAKAKTEFDNKQKAKQESAGKSLDVTESETAWASLGVEAPLQPVEREVAPALEMPQEESETKEGVEEPDWELVKRLENLGDPVQGVPNAPDLEELKKSKSLR